MKCDELKDYDIMDIEAMDDERLEKSESGKIQVTRVYIKSEVDAAIAELKAENERLKRCEIWMKQHFFCEEVIACESAKNRKLKRALWLARASEASKEVNYWTCQDESSYAIVDFNVRHETIVSYKAPHHRPYKWILIWEIVERKCRAKAEEYK